MLANIIKKLLTKVGFKITLNLFILDKHKEILI